MLIFILSITFRYSIYCSVICEIKISVISIFDLFSETNDSFFINYGSDAFKIISIGYILVGFHIILGAVYQSLGYPLKAFLISILRQLMLFIPIVFILTPIYGVMGIWYTFAIADVIAGLISMGILYYEIQIFKKKTST